MNKIMLNSELARFTGASVSGDERENLVAKGKVLVLELTARAHNAALVKSGRPAETYSSAFASENDFQTKKQEWCDDVLHFCAAKALSIGGENVDRNDRRTFTNVKLTLNSLFMTLLSGIISEVQYAVTPPVVNELVGEMASLMYIPTGKTGEVEITSNAVFKWEDASWTSLRSVPQDELFRKSVTLNPRPVATKFHVNWYQMIGSNGSLVDTIAAVAGGYGAMLMQKFTDAFTTAAGKAAYVPSSRRATSYTDSNWATVVRNVAAANRVRRDQLIAYGDYMALRHILPDNATLAPAIMTMLGEEYFKNGYLASHDGVMLYELSPTVTPDTINTTMDPIFPTSTVVIAAKGNSRYAPMLMGFEEGGEGQINLTPGDDVIANGYIEGLAYASLDIVPCFTSAIGLITNVV